MAPASIEGDPFEAIPCFDSEAGFSQHSRPTGTLNLHTNVPCGYVPGEPQRTQIFVSGPNHMFLHTLKKMGRDLRNSTCLT